MNSFTQKNRLLFLRRYAKFNSVNETVPNDLVIIKELFEPPKKIPTQCVSFLNWNQIKLQDM